MVIGIATPLSVHTKKRPVRLLTEVVLRFLTRLGGPSLPLLGGGWVRANKMSSGMKSLCREVGNGFVLSMSLLDRSTGSSALEILNTGRELNFNLYSSLHKDK